MTPKTIAALALALAVIAGACGGDDDQARTLDTTTTTAEPSRDDRANADNGDDDDVEDEDATAPTKPAASNLDQVILTLADLPAGWTTAAEDPDDTTDDSFCGDVDPLADVEPAAEAEVSFQQSEMGPFLAAVALRFDDGADDVMDLFAEAVDACREFTETDEDGNETVYRFDPMSFPSLGDGTFAARLSSTTFLGPLSLDMVTVREDDVVLLVMNGGLGAADTALTEQALRTMLDRL